MSIATTNFHMLFRMIRKIKVSRDWLDAALTFLSTSQCSQNRSPSRLSVSLM